VAIFRRELPDVGHVAIGWESPETGDVTEWRAANYLIYENVVLAATRETLRPPPHPNGEVTIRPCVSDDDWEQAIRNQIDTREAHFSLESYSIFKRRQFARYREMTARGLGAWFGAFAGDRLVADCGVYTDGGELGRFQSVGTREEFRRRGICGSLVSFAASHAFERLGASRLVMVADEHYHAARIYESVGFAPAEKQRAASWWPSKPAS
jgi:RimJ/RimL family protein N-acetyltransferase